MYHVLSDVYKRQARHHVHRGTAHIIGIIHPHHRHIRYIGINQRDTVLKHFFISSICDKNHIHIRINNNIPVSYTHLAKLKTAISATGYEVKGISSEAYEKKKGLYSFFPK